MIERLLLLFGLIGAIWAALWLVRQERRGDSAEKDFSPFAMRTGEDFLARRSREQEKKRNNSG